MRVVERWYGGLGRSSVRRTPYLGENNKHWTGKHADSGHMAPQDNFDRKCFLFLIHVLHQPGRDCTCRPMKTYQIARVIVIPLTFKPCHARLPTPNEKFAQLMGNAHI